MHHFHNYTQLVKYFLFYPVYHLFLFLPFLIYHILSDANPVPAWELLKFYRIYQLAKH